MDEIADQAQAHAIESFDQIGIETERRNRQGFQYGSLLAGRRTVQIFRLVRAAVPGEGPCRPGGGGKGSAGAETRAGETRSDIG